MIYTAFRVFNAAKERVLLFRFRRAEVWTIPITHEEVSPINFLDFLSSTLVLGRSFSFMGFIPIISLIDKDVLWSNEKMAYTSSENNFKVFDFQYEGVIRPRLSSAAEKYYDMVDWCKPDGIMDIGFVNKITKTFYLTSKSKSLLNQG